VTAYARTSVELERTCKPGTPVVTSGFVRHYVGDPMGEVAGIRDALHPGEIVDFSNTGRRSTGECRCGF